MGSPRQSPGIRLGAVRREPCHCVCWDESGAAHLGWIDKVRLPEIAAHENVPIFGAKSAIPGVVQDPPAALQIPHREQPLQGISKTVECALRNGSFLLATGGASQCYAQLGKGRFASENRVGIDPTCGLKSPGNAAIVADLALPDRHSCLGRSLRVLRANFGSYSWLPLLILP